MEGTALFSPCGVYRYLLTRTWDRGLSRVLFVMLNPSTADEAKSDPTVTRCINYAKSWGFGGLEVANLFALRSTDPKALRHHDDPVGPENDAHLRNAATRCSLTVCAWGNHGLFDNRSMQVISILRGLTRLSALKLTKDGTPSHPLYLRKTLTPRAFDCEGAIGPELSMQLDCEVAHNE